MAQVLLFRPVFCSLPYDKGADSSASTLAGAVVGLQGGPLSSSSCEDQSVVLHSDTSRANDVPASTVLLADTYREGRYVLGPADISGSAIAAAWTEPGRTAGGGSEVVLEFTSSGESLLNRVAGVRYAAYESNPSDPSPASEEAIDMNGTVVSVAVMEIPSIQGCLAITGSSHHPMSTGEAANLLSAVEAASHIRSASASPSCSSGGPAFTLTGKWRASPSGKSAPLDG